MKRNNLPPVLSIAGSDCSGGAGIQADLKTMTALGCYGMSVITALTAQNTQGVQGVYSIPPEFVAKQLDSVFSDIPPISIKIGMLHDVSLIQRIAEFLRNHSHVPVILDPVMVATSGDPLLESSALEALQNELFPLSALLTPNTQELELLSGFTISDSASLVSAAERVYELWKVPVLGKGGDLEGESSSIDVLIGVESGPRLFVKKRIESLNTHGTGCTLSSAIASHIARGFELISAIEKSKEYIQSAIEAGSDLGIGRGRGPVNHLWQIQGVIQ